MQTGSGKMQEAYGAPDVKRRGIYTYEAPWTIYGMNWSVRADTKFRLAVGSFIEDYGNKVLQTHNDNFLFSLIVSHFVLGFRALRTGSDFDFGLMHVFNQVEVVQLDDDSGKFTAAPHLSFDHPYPATKIMFIPDKESQKPDLLATTGDNLRIWQIHEDKVELKSVLNNRQNSDYCSPLTSFDWNESDLRRLGTSSIDTTCTIWDIETGVVDTQLIAHDKEVHDIAWGGVGVFASVSADGSVRVFDLRDKQHSTIIYESPQPATPLLRLGWNKQDPRFMATILLDSSKVVILDIR